MAVGVTLAEKKLVAASVMVTDGDDESCFLVVGGPNRTKKKLD